MRQADAFDSTYHTENLSRILRHALRLAELAGEEQDAVRRDQLIHAAMSCWRAAQRLRRVARSEGVRMSAAIWAIWTIVTFVLATTGRAEPASILSGLPWWHRVIGTAAAMMFYGAHLGLLK